MLTKKQERALMFINYLLLAFVINSAATILNGGFVDTSTYLVGMFMAFSINFVAGIIIPVPKIGMAVANGLGLKEGTLLHKLIRVFVINAIFVTIISFCIALINLGPIPELFSIWWKTYPILHLVGFITSILMENGCIALAKLFD